MSPLLAALAFTQAEPVNLLIQTPNVPKMEGTAKEEALGLFRSGVEGIFQRRLEENGYRVTFVPPTDGLDRPIRGEEAKKLAALGFGRAYVLRLEKWDQRNASHADMLSNPNAPKSQTKLQGKFWVVADGAANPEQKVEGRAGGPYFGTTDRWETSGSPDAKAYNIRLVNKQRTEAIASAAWDAVKMQFPKRP